MSKIGYARASTTAPDATPQVDALLAAGCERLFIDHASRARVDRPELVAALASLYEGDQLAVWRLDRLGRSLGHLISVVTELGDRSVDFQSLTEEIDTRAPGGESVFHLFEVLAQFDRALTIERTQPGLEAARARGKRKGGRRSVLTPEKLAIAGAMLAAGEHTMDEIAVAVGVSRATLYRWLRPTDLQ